MSDISVQLTAPNGRSYTQPIGLFINNEFVAAKSGEKFATVNPSNEAEITSVYAAGEEDVDIAVKAARKALKDPSWKLLPATDRGDSRHH
ncbi:Aldehyde dehydrogenase N-terminal [Penicillium expansum]|nr:Aldehyde dehydrogenase N-terminal [Penicillium expansum]